jgi:NAD(P)-dependent dehydrogenase (short-subunit alcohol dehydrogenase family)
VAIVTGAGRGIGAAVARALAARGVAVGLVDIARERVSAVAAEIGERGGRAVAEVADVGDEQAVAESIERVAAELGSVDLLACLAGVVGYASAPDCDAAEWDRIMRVNAKGPFLCVKHAVPYMRRSGGGAIVLTSSVLATASEQTAVAYSASKGAVEAMTRTLALDHAGDGIRVNCIVPGIVRTGLLEDAAGGANDPIALIASWGRRQPLGRVIEVDEAAAPVVFLLSDEASAITGSTYRVDGGLLARLG